jgi:Flp pilus assembly protein TadG
MRAPAHRVSPLRRLVRRLARFQRSCQGVAAVEFAMVLPVMVLMYLGMTELTFAVNTDRKITLLSRTLADLTGRATSVTTTEMDTIFSAALAVMAPYNSDQAKLTISSIVVKDTGLKDTNGKAILKGTVCWSTARGPGNPAGLAKGSVVTVPEGFQTADSSYILTNVDMPYSPVFGASILQMITGQSSKSLSEETPWPVRNVKEVVWQGTAPCLS